GRPFSRDDRGERSDSSGTRARYGRSDREAEAPPREKLPDVPLDITAEELDKEVREELRSLPGDLAELVGRHLVAAERALEDDDPDRAHEHTKVARRFAARIGVVREAAGIVAYRAGHFSEALSDLRAARRMTGSDAYLPVMADCERGLGRPERAIDLVRSPEAERLDRAGRIELTIVESGARRDLGQHDAAIITLQRLPELRDPQPRPWSARLAFAYADALADAGQQEAAAEWFGRAMAFDDDGETDAAERYAELTGAVIEDVEEDFDDADAGETDEEPDDAEAGDLLEEEQVPEGGEAEGAADVADREPRSEVPSDEPGRESEQPSPAEVPDEPEGSVAEPDQEPLQASAAEVRDGGPEQSGPADAAEGPDDQQDAPEATAQVQALSITPAFIEPDFGDALDESDEGASDDKPKNDD
ncbi:hypothetical protein, partial [Nonomuraea sp. NPDC049784]|uniref:hypothetical protein n=1 Tax=Nonomuraea sp. NPDC049784 TaxID=3154361 RepID=UPI0033F7C7AE